MDNDEMLSLICEKLNAISSESYDEHYSAAKGYDENSFFLGMLDKIEAAANYFDNKAECRYLLEQMANDKFGDLQNKFFEFGLGDFVVGFMYFRSKTARNHKEMINHPYYSENIERISIDDDNFIDHLDRLSKAHELCLELKKLSIIFSTYCLAGSYLISLIIEKYPELVFEPKENCSFLFISDLQDFREKFRNKSSKKEHNDIRNESDK